MTAFCFHLHFTKHPNFFRVRHIALFLISLRHMDKQTSTVVSEKAYVERTIIPLSFIKIESEVFPKIVSDKHASKPADGLRVTSSLFHFIIGTKHARY